MTRAAWNAARRAQLAAMWGALPIREIAQRQNTSVGAVYRIAREEGLPFEDRGPSRLADTHRAIRDRTTRYPGTIVEAADSPRLLVDGGQHRKLGRRVKHGPWQGCAIYALTLVERETCPSGCREWFSCYGNRMHLARRHRAGPDLEERLIEEVMMLGHRHPEGFAVRLHVLGDFYSEAYADLWGLLLEDVPQLHLFGFTAHLPRTAIGSALGWMNAQYPERCNIRVSGQAGPRGSLVIDRAEESQHVVCPYERGRVKDCASCGLCWKIARTIEFVRH